MGSPQIIQKIDRLPEPVKEQLYDYIEFLVVKYLPEDRSLEEEDHLELSDFGKQLLADRIKEHDQDKSKASTWTEFKEETMKNRGYKL